MRVHSEVVASTTSWVRLWYLLRALDIEGSGLIECELSILWKLLDIAPSTLRGYLKDGKKIGGFRFYKTGRGRCKIYYASLFNLLKALGVRGIGVATEVPLTSVDSLMGLRSTATAVTAQSLQQQSCYAAHNALTETERKSHRVLTTHQIVGLWDSTSHKPDRGAMNHIYHVGQKRIFVGSYFVPVGSSQKTIAHERGISSSTVYRHLKRLEVDRRQLVQTKADYSAIAVAIKHDGDCWSGGKISRPTHLQKVSEGEWLLSESNGNSVTRRPNYEIHRNRIFRYRDLHWLYRCNLYNLDYSLKSMAMSRRRYKSLIRRSAAKPPDNS